MTRRSFLALLGLTGGGGSVLWLGCGYPAPSWGPAARLLVPVPVDDDEYVAAPRTEPAPVVQGSLQPNGSWQARAAQLEVNGVSTEGAPGPWPGRERSHVPIVTQDSLIAARVTVLVQHVMRGQRGVTVPIDAAAPGPDATAAPDGEPPTEGGEQGDAGPAEEPAGPLAEGGDEDAAGDGASPSSTLADGSDGDEPYHFITTIYLKSDAGIVVALLELQPSDGEPPAATFVLPAGVGSVTAYAACNLHGVWAAAPLVLRT